MAESVVLESSVQFALQSSMRAQEGLQKHFFSGLACARRKRRLAGKDRDKACPPNLAGSLLLVFFDLSLIHI